MENKYNRKKKKKKIKVMKATECWLCREKLPLVDYKDLDLLEKFFTPHGKMMNRRRTGICVQHMNDVSRAAKRAQQMALIPFKVY
jgi:small subunit ribosomal protein S18